MKTFLKWSVPAVLVVAVGAYIGITYIPKLVGMIFKKSA